MDGKTEFSAVGVQVLEQRNSTWPETLKTGEARIRERKRKENDEGQAG